MIKTIFKPFYSQIVRRVNPAYGNKWLIANTERVNFNFSEEKKPRNKEEAYRMQQEKQFQTKPLTGDEDFFSASTSKYAYYMMGFGIICLGALVYYADYKSQERLGELENDITGIAELKEKQPKLGGDWTLIDMNGNPISSSNLEGYYYLLYFGFTKCPDICPNTLYRLATIYRVIRNMPEGAYLKLRIVFVSVDPDRDTPQLIKKYLANFGKQIIGVTGPTNEEQDFKAFLRKYKVYSKKIAIKEGPKKGEYLLDHTNLIYLIDSQNRFVEFVNPELTEHQAAQNIVSKIVAIESENSLKNKKLRSAWWLMFKYWWLKV